MTGDNYKRREVGEGVYQCGCRWVRDPQRGDVLKECPIHQQATRASVAEFERKRAEKEDRCGILDSWDRFVALRVEVEWLREERDFEH